MRIGVNGIRLVTPRSGVGRYIENVLRCWTQDEKRFDSIDVYTPSPLRPGETLPPPARNVVVPPWGPYAAWEQIQLPRRHGPNDVLFCPSYVAPVRARCPIVLVHHGSYEGFPGEFSWWVRFKTYHLYRASARRADVVITVSEHSRRDMERFYGLPAESIHVIPEGVDISLFHPVSDAARLTEFRRRVLGTDVPFFLFVGKPVRRRNLPTLLRAFARLRDETHCEHHFLLIGTDLPGAPIRHIIAELGLEDVVHQVGYASHEEIVLAYNAATALIYPSSYEGFGMPVLEAMACGTPTIALRTSAFPEFADGVALLLDDCTVEGLVNAMRRVMEEPELVARMRRDGPERAHGYDWSIIARKTMDLIVKLDGRPTSP